jgi:hypothetical protein
VGTVGVEADGEQPAGEVLPHYRGREEAASSDHGRWQQMVEAIGAIMNGEPEGGAMSWWRFLTRRRRDLDEEIEAHLRMKLGLRQRRSSAMCCW